MRRRHFMVAATAAATTRRSARAATPNKLFGDVDWRQAAGQSINVFMAGHPWQEAIEPELPRFKALTGIEIGLSKLPEAQYKTKLASDLSAGTFEYDVFMNEYYDAQKYQTEQWTLPLDPLLRDPKLTDAGWFDWSDFFPAARAIANIGGRYTDRIAITAEAQILLYRRDVLSGLGLLPAQDFDVLLSESKKIDGSGRVKGITLRGGAALWWPLYGLVRSYGGDYLVGGKPVIDSAADQEAVRIYADLARTAPPGITSFDWDEINTALLSGEAAMFLDSSVIYSRIRDPDLSTVAGRIGAAPFPNGPAGRRGASHFWSISIAKRTRRNVASWLFVQWATSPPMQALLQSKEVLAPRESAFAAVDSSKNFDPDFINAVRTSLRTAVILPANAHFFELMDPLRAAVQRVVLGDQPVGPALTATEADWTRILA